MCLTDESVGDKLQRIMNGYLASLTVMSLLHTQDDNGNVQNHTCKQPLTRSVPNRQSFSKVYVVQAYHRHIISATTGCNQGVATVFSKDLV